MKLTKKICLFVAAALLLVPGACSVGDLPYAGRETECDGELPVEFDISLPGTRAIENPKTKFTAGDVIHVEATFDAVYDGKHKDVYRYGALVLTEGRWVPVSGSGLTWPNTAERGTFRAYFISGSTGLLYIPGSSEGSSATRTYHLSDITPDGSNSDQAQSWSDPLEAKSEVVEYGYAVRLDFKHICAYLTLKELEPMVSDEYWLTREDGEPFNNAFSLSLNEDNTLEFKFFAESDPSYTVDGEPLVYISGKSRNIEEAGRTITVADYFLAPGDYSTFVLRYPTVAPASLSYMRYDYAKIPEGVGSGENIKPVLEAGHTYVLNVTKSPGTTVTMPPDGEGWDESDDYVKVDPKEFLEHVQNGTAYGTEYGEILEQTPNGTRLRRNVDFGGKFDYWDTFVPELPAGRTFDGDCHYIKQVGGPLFHYNHGTIKNLGIKGLTAEFVTYEDDDEAKDMSRLGGLCMWNRTTGIIENIRMSAVSMTAKLKTADEEGQETHNIGCVAGSNSGRISQVALSGKLHLTVQNHEADAMDATAIIGGVVGQNAGTGRIEDVTSLDGDLEILVENKCTGTQGAFYVGGIAGYSSAYIDGVILPDVTVDGRESEGVVSFMGCMVGELTVSDSETESNAGMTSCIVSGKVLGGKVRPSGYLTSVSYIGGLAGALMRVPVIGCRAAVSISGAEQADAVEGVLYATGGAFGRIRTSTQVENIIAYGSRLAGPRSDDAAGVKGYIGNFAGIIPAAETWDDSYSGHNIVVRVFGTEENVGASLD